MELRQISLREIYTTTTVMWRIERCQNAGALVLRLKNKYIHFSYFYWFTLLFYFLFLSASGEAGNLCFSKTENSLLVITRLQELKLYQRLQSDNTVKPKELPQCRLRWSSAAEQSRWQAARVCLWSHALRTFLMLHFSQGGDDGLWSFALCSEAAYDFFLFFFFFLWDKLLQNPAVPLREPQVCMQKQWVPPVTPAQLPLSTNMRYPSEAGQVCLSARLISPCPCFWMKGGFESIPPGREQLLSEKPGRDF